MKIFVYGKNKYKIESSKIISTGGDIDEIGKIIYVDKDIPEKFHQGIAVHEIEERKLLNKGHTYVFSHNEAQKKEAKFYEKIYGKNNGVKTLGEEEVIILRVTHRRSLEKSEAIPAKKIGQPAKINIQFKNNGVIFGGRRYTLDKKERLIGTLADVYPKGKIVYIDRGTPEKFHEGLIVGELVTRKYLDKGLGWGPAHSQGNRAEEKFLEEKYGKKTAKKLVWEELVFQAKKFAEEEKGFKTKRGHKIFYGKWEILPK